MKTFFYSLLQVALLLAFIGCSNDNGSEGGSSGGNNSDVNVPTGGKSADELLKSAVDELKRERWDEAIAYYNAAYEKDSDNPKTIIYSVLANLAKISTDPKVVTLMKEHFGFTTYPNKLNALLDDKWMKDYCDLEYDYYDRNLGQWVDWEKAQWGDVSKDGYYYYDYKTGKYTFVSDKPKCYNEKLPAIKTPDWVQGKGSIYNNALLSGNVMSIENWSISLLANVLDKNSNGFNPLLDDVIDGVFGASFNLALERLSKLEKKPKNSITLDPYFIEELDLEDVFDDTDQVGWAEVNAVLSAMLLVKSSLEWVQSYDLSTDLNWLKYSWKDDEADMRNHFKNVDASKLPFNNNFFKVRPGKMEKAKADYVKAIEGFQNSYASIIKNDIYPPEVKDYYGAINGGFGELINAIKTGGKFYIPEKITKGGTWPTSKNGNVVATINLGKFFTEGYFSLPNIFETSGSKPAFYLTYDYYGSDGYDSDPCHWEEYEYWDEDLEDWDYDYDWVCDYREPEPKREPVLLDKSNYKKLLDEGDGYLSLALKTAQFKAIADIDDLDYNQIEYIPTGLEGINAKVVFEKYYP